MDEFQWPLGDTHEHHNGADRQAAGTPGEGGAFPILLDHTPAPARRSAFFVVEIALIFVLAFALFAAAGRALGIVDGGRAWRAIIFLSAIRAAPVLGTIEFLA